MSKFYYIKIREDHLELLLEELAMWSYDCEKTSEVANSIEVFKDKELIVDATNIT